MSNQKEDFEILPVSRDGLEYIGFEISKVNYSKISMSFIVILEKDGDLKIHHYQNRAAINHLEANGYKHIATQDPIVILDFIWDYLNSENSDKEKLKLNEYANYRRAVL